MNCPDRVLTSTFCFRLATRNSTAAGESLLRISLASGQEAKGGRPGSALQTKLASLHEESSGLRVAYRDKTRFQRSLCRRRRNEGTVSGSRQKSFSHQRLKDRFAGKSIQLPQPTRLRERES